MKFAKNHKNKKNVTEHRCLNIFIRIIFITLQFLILKDTTFNFRLTGKLRKKLFLVSAYLVTVNGNFLETNFVYRQYLDKETLVR